MLDLLRKDVIDEALHAHRAKIFDTDAATGRLSTRSLTLQSFWAPIATFVRRKTDTDIVSQNTAISKASKRELDAATETYGNAIESW